MIKLLNCVLNFISSHDCNMMPSLYVRPVVTSTDSEQDTKQDEKFNCPVFINRARQVCPFHLPFNSGQPADKWTMAGTALILDPGQ